MAGKAEYDQANGVQDFTHATPSPIYRTGGAEWLERVLAPSEYRR